MNSDSLVVATRRPRRRCLAAVVAAIAWAPLYASSEAHSATGWADPRLEVRDGLELWLDASRPDGAQPTTTGEALAFWADASGKGRDLRQVDAQARPTLLKQPASAVVRFDGVDDCLRTTGQAAELRSFTVVTVAVPRLNIGAFRGLLATNAKNERDYTSGVAVDLGPWATSDFSSLNVEGRGFTGAQSLRTQTSPFGRLDVLVVESDVDQRRVQLSVNGQSEGQRPRDGDAVSLDELTLGARHYSNDAGPQRPTGHIRADIAEVLVYNRVLNAAETEAVNAYLNAKYEPLKNAVPPDATEGSEPLEQVADPPAVQMFVPGFAVRELPVELSNVNNVKYRSDGALVALGYDGKVWLLRDSDGDGAEDRADLFWSNDVGLKSPIGMDLTPPAYARGEGVFVVGKTRCLLIVDTDDDDRADKVIDVADGWKESFHQVDGLGVAFDPRDGSVYYGRGTYNFTDPLLRDKDGKPQYRLTDESGAIIRVSPDFQRREIVATGIRFPVALRFNRRGDLFATDQEGATWVPNGNPLDELLHVQQGRHYGFPSRHPTHLPDVIDEPSTFDFAPQHQCTCGLNFNEPVEADGPTFGPAAWAGDALVAGYSRGKLYRTQLVKSTAGYVARTQLLACLKMLTVDACVSPQGDLVVACHSGGPDWGSGPTGVGKLFKIHFADAHCPQPILAWPSGPRELRLEFDRPVDPKHLHDLLAHTKLTSGRYVRAGDRFESLWPGYAAVQAQKLASRTHVPLHSAQLTPDGRSLVLAVDPLSEAVQYALQLPAIALPAADHAMPSALPQHPAIDLDFDLSGCEATWRPADGGPDWTGWLPHFDLSVSRQLTAGSAPHDRLWAAMAHPGKLTLRGQLDLADMLRPAIQPGSKLDYDYPPESPTVTFETTRPSKLSLSMPDAPITTSKVEADSQVSLMLPADASKVISVELQLEHSGDTPPTLAASWTTNEDSRPRPLPLRRQLVPWARPPGDLPAVAANRDQPELKGGHWLRGQKEFFGSQAGCSKCHKVRGEGGALGPDLSNLIHRDYASVLRDVTQPGFAINPDFVSQLVILKSGRTLAGAVRTEGDKLIVTGQDAKETAVPRAEVESIEPSPLSLMPTGIPELLGPDRLRDLLAFLLIEPPHMPAYGDATPPPPRPLAEVAAALAGSSSPASGRRLSVVLVAGPKDHGVGEHDYPAWQTSWRALLGMAHGVNVLVANSWPSAADLQHANVLVFYQQGAWTPDRARDIDQFLKRGGGIVYIHYAVDGGNDAPGLAQRIGLAWRGGQSKFRHGPLEVRFVPGGQHPIARHLDHVHLVDESYWNLVGAPQRVNLLATGVEEGQPQPLFWTVEQGRGRVFVSLPGHFSWTFDDPIFRLLLLRGIAWTAKEPVDRFNELVLPGARVDYGR